MSAITFAKAPVAFTSTHLVKRQARRNMQRCYAEEERKLSFDSNKRSGIGFVEQDSAGQTNIFAVEPKSYVKGSNTDGTDNSANDTLSLAAVAGTVAAGAIVAGLITISGSFSDEVVPAPSSEYKSLTAYSAQFTAELAAAAPVAAPELTSE